MKELVKHLPAIKTFMEERTQAFQEISEQMLKNFLREAYKLPFLFPVRIIVNEDKFVNFLFDIRKELLEGKKIEVTPPQEAINNTTPSIEIEEKKESSTTEELKPASKAKTTTTKKSTKKITDTTQELSTENVKTNKTTKAKKTLLTDKL
ncbi:MAG: hypothetical protein SFU27_06310 [Thermonemataceae bacterium]|nr:hypothetical protein [Thermonemataceae bacterium]